MIFSYYFDEKKERVINCRFQIFKEQANTQGQMEIFFNAVIEELNKGRVVRSENQNGLITVDALNTDYTFELNRIRYLPHKKWIFQVKNKLDEYQNVTIGIITDLAELNPMGMEVINDADDYDVESKENRLWELDTHFVAPVCQQTLVYNLFDTPVRSDGFESSTAIFDSVNKHLRLSDYNQRFEPIPAQCRFRIEMNLAHLKINQASNDIWTMDIENVGQIILRRDTLRYRMHGDGSDMVAVFDSPLTDKSMYGAFFAQNSKLTVDCNGQGTILIKYGGKQIQGFYSKNASVSFVKFQSAELAPVSFTAEAVTEYSDDMCSGGTKIGSENLVLLDNAFDEDEHSFWYTESTGAAIENSAWIGYDFGESVTHAIRKVIIRQKGKTGVKHLRIESSYNGIDWKEVYFATNLVSYDDNFYDSEILLPPNYAQRYWRMYAMGNPTAYEFNAELVPWEVYDLKMFEMIDHQEVTPISSGDRAGFPVENAYDNSLDSEWQAELSAKEMIINGENPNVWIGYDFGKATSISKIKITQKEARASSRYRIQKSNDQITWEDGGIGTLTLAYDQDGNATSIIDNSTNDLPIDTAPARFWRIVPYEVPVLSEAERAMWHWTVGELEFHSFVSTPDMAYYGKGIASNQDEEVEFPVAHAFDKSMYTYWASTEIGADVREKAWIGYDFGEGRAKQVTKVVVKNHSQYIVGAVKIQSSEEGETWVDITTAETKELVNSIPLLKNNPARYWRVMAMTPVYAYGDVSQTVMEEPWMVPEIEMMEDIELDITDKPIPPRRLRAEKRGDKILLGWFHPDRVEKDKRIGSYRIYQNGLFVKAVSNHSYEAEVDNLNDGETYEFTVKAVDLTFKESDPSKSFKIKAELGLVYNENVIGTGRAISSGDGKLPDEMYVREARFAFDEYKESFWVPHDYTLEESARMDPMMRWIGYDFGLGNPKHIRQIVLYQAEGFDVPEVTVERSVDGMYWEPVKTDSTFFTLNGPEIYRSDAKDLSNTAVEEKTFQRLVKTCIQIPETASAQFWRVKANALGDSYAIPQWHIHHIEMMEGSYIPEMINRIPCAMDNIYIYYYK